MLFLLRPRQTWMPYGLPRDRPQQLVYNQQLQSAYMSTRRVGPAAADQPRDKYTDLVELERLHQSGVLSDAEFASAKTRVLDSDDGTS